MAQCMPTERPSQKTSADAALGSCAHAAAAGRATHRTSARAHTFRTYTGDPITAAKPATCTPPHSRQAGTRVAVCPARHVGRRAGSFRCAAAGLSSHSSAGAPHTQRHDTHQQQAEQRQPPPASHGSAALLRRRRLALREYGGVPRCVPEHLARQLFAGKALDLGIQGDVLAVCALGLCLGVRAARPRLEVALVRQAGRQRLALLGVCAGEGVCRTHRSDAAAAVSNAAAAGPTAQNGTHPL